MKLIEVGLMLENNGVESSPYNDYMIELILEACEKEAQEKVREIFEKVEKQIWKSAYIAPTNKPRVISGIKQALKQKLGIEK